MEKGAHDTCARIYICVYIKIDFAGKLPTENKIKKIVSMFTDWI